ncbi:NAD(P)H-dependent oxidoreductase [Phytoactinopolyspora alkaliphila]|uniref:NAD(P)H-dependent oxidoreductase n=1 Tax=Phytoactinopolyspora alkaliphila TaxID=1783498 RepID=A0A6N9YJV7_9ACTN|nr:NAD(P)H-dependent oxidoreductase [Phytoactinopolyspora alkaliphila]NED95341.1 NAD(P)H-dependent oxidoreductase [Phytoactinopolyspora alkaliphila]
MTGTTSSPTARIPLRTAVIVGSTREGRTGESIARWFAGRAAQDERLTVDLVDLARYDLPRRLPRRPTLPMRELTATIDRAEAFVLVTPEYNHGYPASLKQAIDVGCDEWFAKPVGFVAYGTGGHGTRAVEQLRLVFAALHVVTVPDVVSFDLADGTLHDGRPRDGERTDVAVRRMLRQLTWWAEALREAHAARPYVA